MRRSLVLLLALGAAACQDLTQPQTAPQAPLASVAPQASVQSGRDRVVGGEVIVKLKDGADPAVVAAAHGLQLGRAGYHDAFRIFRGAMGAEHANARAVAQDARVVYAEPNYLRQTTTIDPRLWAFYNPGGLQLYYTRGRNNGKPVSGYESVADADEDNIENYGSGGSDVVIGSIDTGVDFNHTEFLSGQLIKGQDWYSGDNDPSDEDGHGTHTTGTMVGRTVGVAGVSGAGPHVKVFVQRVCGAQGCPTTAIVNAIRAAADYGVVAMNMSLGGASESQAEKEAIAYATGKNALVIASAGNDGTGTVSCPACDPKAISVAATNWQDALSYYSNWGAGLDISAPGGEMYSNTSEDGGIYSAYMGGGYAYLQGTSMAAPQVTGTAAVVASKTGLTGSSLLSHILGTADDLGASGYDTNFGNGRVNTYRAVMNTTLDPANDPGNGGGTTNQPPTAGFTWSCADLTCQFTDQSTDDGSIVAWSWDFGDNSTSTAQTPSHTFSAGGTYTVTLTVTDGGNLPDTVSHAVTVTSGGGSGDVITLSVSTSSHGPNVFADLTWSGSSAASVDIYRGLNTSNLTLYVTTSNSGSYSDKLGKNWTGTASYQVCNAGGTDVCSTVQSISVP